MRWRIALVALVVLAAVSAGSSIGAPTPRAPRPEATCMLPGAIACLTDAECAAYNALCDVQNGACYCPGPDLGVDFGSPPGDFAIGDAGGGGGGGGSTGTAPPASGGGMTSPPKSGGCSFAPGAR